MSDALTHDPQQDYIASLERQVADLTARVAELEERLEIGYAFDAMGVRVVVPKEGFPDGIACRDATIQLQKQQVTDLTARAVAAEQRCQDYVIKYGGNPTGARVHDRCDAQLDDLMTWNTQLTAANEQYHEKVNELATKLHAAEKRWHDAAKLDPSLDEAEELKEKLKAVQQRYETQCEGTTTRIRENVSLKRQLATMQAEAGRLQEVLKGRRLTIETSIAAEVLAGNTAKEHSERTALVEIYLMEQALTPPVTPTHKETMMLNPIPRRARIDLMTQAELAIRDVSFIVEHIGCHPLLTEAVILLSQAREKVADYVDGQALPKVTS